MRKKNYYWMIGIALSVIVLTIYYTGLMPESAKPSGESGIKFYDAHLQAQEFIAYYNSIALTPEQEKIKSKALSAIPAPCCSNYSILTCCCPCNLAKSVWGLSNFLIAKLGFSANQVKEAVLEWIHFTNKDGYAGNACYMGRCNSSFKEDGCGGMNERRIF
jgi:hypothetical protein